MSLSCIKELIIFCNKPKCDIYLTTNSSYTNLYSYKKTSEHRCSYKKNKEICYCYHFIHQGRNWEKSRGLFQFQVLEAPTLMDLIQKKKKKKPTVLSVTSRFPLLQRLKWYHPGMGSKLQFCSVFFRWLHSNRLSLHDPNISKIYCLSLSSPTGKIKILLLGFSIRDSLPFGPHWTRETFLPWVLGVCDVLTSIGLNLMFTSAEVWVCNFFKEKLFCGCQERVKSG